MLTLPRGGALSKVWHWLLKDLFELSAKMLKADQSLEKEGFLYDSSQHFDERMERTNA